MITHVYTLEPMRKKRRASSIQPFFCVPCFIKGQDEMAEVILNIMEDADVSDIENTKAYSFFFSSVTSESTKMENF